MLKPEERDPTTGRTSGGEHARRTEPSQALVALVATALVMLLPALRLPKLEDRPDGTGTRSRMA